MNEFIQVDFRKPNGQRLRVKRQTAGGIEFEEPDPIERTVGFQFTARSEATRARMRSIAQVKGWNPGTFDLKASVEDGSIVLRGVDPDALPRGHYALRVEIEESELRQASTSVDVDDDGHGELTVEVRQDDRTVDVDLTNCDGAIDRVVKASTIDDHPAAEWFEEDFRPTRKACALNLLATLRVTPLKTSHLLTDVKEIVRVLNDRVYLKVDAALHARLETLVSEDRFDREGPPHAPIHRRLLDAIPADERPQFGPLISYRSEGRPSMQVVIAVPPVGLTHTYGDFDLDLGNPLQDLLGFFTHMGELLDGKPTNHLDLRKQLAKKKAGEFLYYTIV